MAHLPRFFVYRHSSAPRRQGNLRRQPGLLIEMIVITQINLQAYNLPRRTALTLFSQLPAADEMLFFQINSPAQTDLKRRIFLRRNKRLLHADIIDFQQNKSRLKARDVESQHPRRLDTKVLPVFHERVPNSLRMLGSNPNFVSKIAGVPGPRDNHGNAADISKGESKKSQLIQAAIDELLKNFE